MLIRDLRVKKTIPIGELDDYYIIINDNGVIKKMTITNFMNAICPPEDQDGPFLAFDNDDIFFSGNIEVIP